MSLLARLSLRTRLTLLAMATLLPLTALVVLSDFEDRDERRESAVASSKALGESIASTVDSFARDLESLTLAASLALGANGRPISQDEYGGYIVSLAASYDVLRSLFVTDLEGRVIATQRTTSVGLDLSTRPYIVALKGGAETAWTGSFSALQSGQSIAPTAG